MNTSTIIHSLLQHLSAVFGRESDQILQEQLGLGFAQFRLLRVIQEDTVSQQRQIAVALGQTEASVSRQIRYLKKKGLLESRPNPHNRREHLPSLTSKGLRITEAAQDALKNYQNSSLRHMDAKQRAQLLELLAMVHP